MLSCASGRHFAVHHLTLSLPPSPQLLPETLYLTTNLIDRFLELKGISRKNLQLVRPSDIVSYVQQHFQHLPVGKIPPGYMLDTQRCCRS